MKKPTKLVIIHPNGSRQVINTPMIVHHYDLGKTLVVELEKDK